MLKTKLLARPRGVDLRVVVATLFPPGFVDANLTRWAIITRADLEIKASASGWACAVFDFDLVNNTAA